MRLLNLNECESGPQRAGRYLDSLLLSAAYAALARHGRSTEDWALAAEVLTVLALGADCIAVCEKVEALSAEALVVLVGQCRKCVWDAHFSQNWNSVPKDSYRLLEKLFLS